MSDTVILNGIPFTDLEGVDLPGPDGETVRFLKDNGTDRRLDPDSRRPVENRVITKTVEDLYQHLSSPFRVRGSVATPADLPMSGNSQNDTFYVESLKYRVTWNGSEWTQSSMDESAYTGALAALKRRLDASTEPYGRNLFDMERLLEAQGWRKDEASFSSPDYYGALSELCSQFGAASGFPVSEPFHEGTRYTITLSAKDESGTGSGTGLRVMVYYTDGTNGALDFPCDPDVYVKKKITTAAGKTVERIAAAAGGNDSDTWHIREMQIEAGTTASAYQAADWTPVDKVARAGLEAAARDAQTLDERMGDLEDALSSTDALAGRLEVSPALQWDQGNLSPSTGAASNKSAARIRSKAAELKDYVVSADAGYQVFPYYYDAAGAFLGQGGGWITAPTNLVTTAPAGAAQFRLVMAREDLSTALVPEEGGHARFFEPGGPLIEETRQALETRLDTAEARIDAAEDALDGQGARISALEGETDAITGRVEKDIGLTWDWGNINASTGERSGRSSTRICAVNFTPLDDYVAAPDPGYKVFPYFYNGETASAYNNTQAYNWSSAPLALQEIAPAGATHFRLVAARDDNTELSALETDSTRPDASFVRVLVRGGPWIAAVEAAMAEADAALQGEIEDLDAALGWVEGDIGIEWARRNLWESGASVGLARSRPATRICTSFTALGAYTIRPDDGYLCKAFFYSGDSGVEPALSTSGWVRDSLNLSEEAPAGAAYFRLLAARMDSETAQPSGTMEISPAEGEHLRGFIPTGSYLSSLKEELDGRIDELAGSIFTEEINDFVVGGITTGVNGGGETTLARRMKTRNFHKLGEIKISWKSADFAYFIVYYNENRGYIKAEPESGWLREDRTVRQSDVEDARYVRFVFCNTTVGNSYSFVDNGLTLPEGCSIKSTGGAAASVELDTSLTAAGLAADAAAVGEILSRLGWIPLPAFVQGVRRVPSGSISTASSVVNFNITMAEPIYVGTGKTLSVHLAEGWTGSLNYGSSPSGPWSKADSGIISGNYVTQNEYLFVNLSKNENGAAVNVTPMMAVQEKALFLLRGAAANDELQYDTPENLGVINLRKRAHQLVALEYTVTNTLIRYGGGVPAKTYNADDTVLGMVYTSARTEESFVPQTVSIHTFMTAVKNPNSYLYTRQDPVSAQKLYYGAVCSTFVDHCYGIDYSIPTTYMLEDMEGMTRNEDQSVYGLKLGDLLSLRNKHVAVVTDILRNRRTGEIAEITISEASVANSRSRKYTPEEYYERLENEPMVAFRWNKLSGIDYEPSPWVHVGDESEAPEYSTHLSPRRGDKANWRAGETVEVDVLDPGDYPNWKLYKDDIVFQTGALGEADLLSFPGLGYGKYKLCLTGNGTDSEFVYWIVVECQESYTDLGNGKVRCAFSSPNATPMSLNWNYNLAYETDSGKERTGIQNAIFKIEIMDNAARQAGQITSTFEPGTFDMRVAYRTEYGMYWSDVQEVTLA